MSNLSVSLVLAKSENPARPQNREKQKDGARRNGAQVMQEETSQAPPVPTEPPAIALQREHGPAGAALLSALSATERAALVARLDEKPTRADWALWRRDLEVRLSMTSPTEAS